MNDIPSMPAHFAKTAIATSVMVLVIVVLLVGIFGSFYFGQNSIRFVTITQNDASTTQVITSLITSVVTTRTTQSVTSVITSTETVSTTMNSSDLFGSNVKTVTLSSATLYGGTAASTDAVGTSSLTFSLSNPASQSYITSITLTGTRLVTPITSWDNTSSIRSVGNMVPFGAASMSAVGCPTPTWNNNVLCPGQFSSFTLYPEQGALNPGIAKITTGQTFNYVINFANGQSVSGSLIAQ